MLEETLIDYGFM